MTQYEATVDGCFGDLVILHNYNNSGHDFAEGSFYDGTTEAGYRGWTCHFYLQRSTDGGKTWRDISGEHSGVGQDNTTYAYYDGPVSGGPNYEARVSIRAMNPQGTYGDIGHTAAV